MKLMKILLVLVVLSVMMPMASAVHSFTGDSGGDEISASGDTYPSFDYGAQIDDRVGSEMDSSVWMRFEWIDPSDYVSKVAYSTATTLEVGDGQIKYYEDTYSGTDYAGPWKVRSVESDSIFMTSGMSDEGGFVILTAPEFFLGPFMALLIVGILYAVMRRNLAGSFNVN